MSMRINRGARVTESSLNIDAIVVSLKQTGVEFQYSVGLVSINRRTFFSPLASFHSDSSFKMLRRTWAWIFDETWFAG